MTLRTQGMTLRPLRALREINASISELERADVRAREHARIELARSATEYSQKAKDVVDGTMSLSAVLMRAGAVGEAERLLAEVEHDVQQEKEVLLESVQEVKVATRDRREKMTRLRLAKMVATAFLGGSVFAFSAVGLAAAKYFGEILPSAPSASTSVDQPDGRYEVAPTRRIDLALGDMNLRLSIEEYEEFQRLVSSDDPDELRSFLLRILPSGFADKVDRALAQAGITTPVQLAQLEATVDDAAKKASKNTASTDSGSDSSPGNVSGSEGKSDDSKKRGHQDGDESDGDSSAGKSGCEEEDEREGDEQQGNLNPDHLQGCIPLIDEDDSEG